MAEFEPERMARRMQAAGASEELAEATADEVNGAVSGLATRADLEVLRAEMQALRAEMRADMEALRADVRADIQTALHAQTRWIVTFGVALAAVVVAAVAGIVAALV